MLTEHEQLADHEARISRQKLPPLQQPLDNIEEIKHALDDPWLPFDSAPDGVHLLWFIQSIKSYWVCSRIGVKCSEHDHNSCKWQPLPPPPKEQK